MELFLNVVWLLIVVASAAWWRWRLFGEAATSRQRRRAWSQRIALACALAILFPAISVTDNLHPSVYVADDGPASRRTVTRAGGCHGHAHHRILPPAVIPASTRALDGFISAGIVNVTDFFLPAGTPAHVPPQRAPPLV